MLSSVLCHFSELWNLRGVVGTLWICTLLIRSMGGLGPYLPLVSEVGVVSLRNVLLNLWSLTVSPLGAECQDWIAVHQPMSEQLGLKQNRFHSESVYQGTGCGTRSPEANGLWYQKATGKEMKPWGGLGISSGHGIGEEWLVCKLTPYTEGREKNKKGVTPFWICRWQF